jgi:pimeloyl-ACP methyl ester carboxylesterase
MAGWVMALCVVRGQGGREQTRFERLTYRSSVDDTSPLHADVAFQPGTGRKPVLLVMHGYTGTRKHVTADLKQLAPKGLFVVAPDMRGCGDSAGKWDSGGLDVHDILDAARAALERWPEETDSARVSVLGYSGGGGNAMSCAVRFPDFFSACVSFFGISDYAEWHRSRSRADMMRRLEGALGGSPEVVPDQYTARNANAAAGNVLVGRMHLFWDVEERNCPPKMVEEFVRNHHLAGGRRVEAHISRPGDPARWRHGYRSGIDDLAKADDVFLPSVTRVVEGGVELPKKGRLVVPGYLVTRRFSVWVEDGTRGAVTVEYDQSGNAVRVDVVENRGDWKVRIGRGWGG